MVQLGRNEPCHCGSGKKYKKCHLAKDEEAERKALAKAALKPKEETPKSQDETKRETGKKPPAAPPPAKSWLHRTIGRFGFTRPTGPGKTMGGSGK